LIELRATIRASGYGARGSRCGLARIDYEPAAAAKANEISK